MLREFHSKDNLEKKKNKEIATFLSQMYTYYLGLRYMTLDMSIRPGILLTREVVFCVSQRCRVVKQILEFSMKGHWSLR